MIAYIVCADWVDDFQITAVFSTRERAEAFIEEYKITAGDCFIIEEFEIDGVLNALLG